MSQNDSNWCCPQHEQEDKARRRCGAQRGDRVRLIDHADPWSRLQPGTLGTVTATDDSGTVHVSWDDGSTLAMIEAAGDRFEVLS